MDMPWSSTGRPQVVLAGRFALADSDHRTVFRHPTFHALHVHDYQAEWSVSGTRIRLAPGDITLSRSDGWTSYALPRPGFHLCLHFSADLPGSPDLRLPLWLRPGPRGAALSERVRQILRWWRHSSQGDVLAGKTADAALQALLVELAWMAGERDRDPDAAIERLADHIAATSSEDLSVERLAAAVGLSQVAAARRFRRAFGMTMPRFRALCRVEAARRLLATTDLPVAEIGRRVGMPDPQHLNKVMRRLTGACPSQQRRT